MSKFGSYISVIINMWFIYIKKSYLEENNKQNNQNHITQFNLFRI